MPRLWMVDPWKLCRQHLLGEHHECHVFLGKLRKGHRLDGYIKAGHIALSDLWGRHEVLAAEMARRGLNHASPFPSRAEVKALGKYLPAHGHLDRVKAEEELRFRCEACRNLLLNDQS